VQRRWRQMYAVELEAAVGVAVDVAAAVEEPAGVK
jgi:hypothetical protein